MEQTKPLSPDARQKVASGLDMVVEILQALNEELQTEAAQKLSEAP